MDRWPPGPHPKELRRVAGGRLGRQSPTRCKGPEVGEGKRLVWLEWGNREGMEGRCTGGQAREPECDPATVWRTGEQGPLQGDQ